MILANSRGFISSMQNPRLNLSFINSKNALNYFLIRKSNAYNLIGEASIVASTNTLTTLVLLTKCPAHILINKTAPLSENIDTSSKPASLF
jgi:hypothetical protein